MISYTFKSDSNLPLDLPKHLKIKGELPDEIKLALSEQNPITSSFVEINFESSSKSIELLKIDWFRKESDKPNSSVNPLSKKTMVQGNKYLCSPKDLGYIVEAQISHNNPKYSNYKMTITFGPIVLSRETDQIVQSAWKDQLYTLVCKGVIVTTKEAFQFMVVNNDGISCRTTPETELFKTPFSKVSHCEASSTDSTTLKLRFTDKDIRVSIKDIQVRDVIIILINKYRKKLQRENVIKERNPPSHSNATFNTNTAGFDRESIAFKDSINNFRHQNKSSEKERDYNQSISTLRCQHNFIEKEIPENRELQENIKCLTQEGKNYQILIESLQRELAYVKKQREDESEEFMEIKEKSE